MLLLAATAAAQQPLVGASTQHGPIVATKDGLTLPAGEFTVADLIDAVAGYLCRNYLYDHADVEKVPGFTLQRRIGLDALGSEELLYALLAARNLTALPVDELRGVFQIVSLSPERRSTPIATVPWRTPEEVLRRPRLRELVLTAVVLHHADATQLANGLRAQFSFQGMWQPGMPTAAASGPHTLLLHGYRDQVAATIQMVQLVDRETGEAQPDHDPVLARLDALERELATLRAELAQRDKVVPAAGAARSNK
jgi:hypothetical protein